MLCVQLPSHVQLFGTLQTASHQASLSLTISQSLPKFMSIESVMPSNHLILCCPLLCPQYFPASGESAVQIRWPRCWSFNFSISPSNEDSGLNPQTRMNPGLISLQSKGLSTESSPTPQFKSVNSSALCLLYGPALTSIHDSWEEHSFDYTDLCQQSEVFAFYYTV